MPWGKKCTESDIQAPRPKYLAQFDEYRIFQSATKLALKNKCNLVSKHALTFL